MKTKKIKDWEKTKDYASPKKSKRLTAEDFLGEVPKHWERHYMYIDCPCSGRLKNALDEVAKEIDNAKLRMAQLKRQAIEEAVKQMQELLNTSKGS